MSRFFLSKLPDLKISIFSLPDVIEQLIKEEPSAKVSGIYNRDINLGNVGKGIYLLQIKAGDQTVNKQIEIQ